MIEDKQDEGLYLLDHIDKHIPDEFVKGIDSVVEKIRSCMNRADYDKVNECVEESFEMIQNEIKDVYSQSILTAFIIKSSCYRFFLPAVQASQDFFGELWYELAKEGDPILIDSYIVRCYEIAAKRKAYDGFCQGYRG